MTTPSSLGDSDKDRLFADAVEEYYRRLRSAGSVDRVKFAQEFPSIESELVELLAGLQAIHQPAETVNFVPSERPPKTIPFLPTVVRYFGDYELLAEIARGGMGVVYRARQVSLDRPVAIKMILAGRLATEESVLRFRQEATAAAKLQHPNVVTIFEIGEHEGQHFFSMEFVEGQTLAQRVRESPLAARTAAEYVRTIAETMSAVHAAGLLHRDLKPSNVLIESRSGVLRITDFGLAKSLDIDTQMTSTGQVLGTPSYMAPEQAAGQNDRVCPESDVYSIGAILYELITGRPPFVGETPWDTAWQVQHVEPVSPSALNHRVPRDLETICTKCLQKDIARRYRTALELADELGRFLRGEPILARPVGSLERLWRWRQRNPALAGALAAAAVGFMGLLISLVVFAATQRQHAKTLSAALVVSRQRLRQGNYRLAENERDRGLRLCAQGDVDQGCLWLARSLATAPDDATDLRGSIRLNLGAWQRELSALKGIFPGEGRAPTFSRDGSRFATSVLKEAYIRDTATLRLIGSPLPHDGVGLRMEFGNDPNSLFVSSGRLALWKFDGGNWSETRIPWESRQSGNAFYTTDDRVLGWEPGENSLVVRDLSAGRQLHSDLPHYLYENGKNALSPDGKLILTQVKNHKAVLTDLTTGKAIGVPLVLPDRMRAAAFSRDGKLLATAYEISANNIGGSEVQLWNTKTGDKLGSPLKHAGDAGREVHDIRFDAAAKRIVTISRHKAIRVWNPDGELIAGPLAHDSMPQQVSLSDDGRWLTFTSPDNEARLWEVDTQEVAGQPLAHMGTTHYASISPDGSHALTGTHEEARLWQTPTRGRLFPSLEHGEPKSNWLRLKFSDNGKRLMSCNLTAGTARVWDVERRQLIGEAPRQSFGVMCFAVSPDGKWAVTGANQRNKSPAYCTLWNIDENKVTKDGLPQFKFHTLFVGFTPDSRQLIAVGDHGDWYAYDLTEGKIVRGPFRHPMKDIDGQQVTFKISPDGRRMAILSKFESPLSLWDLRTGAMLGQPYEPEGGLSEIAFSPDGKWLAAAGDALTILDAATNEPLPTKFAFLSGAVNVCFAPAGDRLVTAHDDRTVRFWDLETGKQVGTAIEHAQQPALLNFAAGGTLLLSTTTEGGYLWDTATHVQVGPRLNASTSFAVRSDGALIAGAIADEIRLWTIPRPVTDDSNVARATAESVTGLTLNEDGIIEPLDRQAWERRRKP